MQARSSGRFLPPPGKHFHDQQIRQGGSSSSQKECKGNKKICSQQKELQRQCEVKCFGEKMASGGWNFHHEISTDDILVSILYSKTTHIETTHIETRKQHG